MHIPHMPTQHTLNADPPAVVFDDAGSGLFAACQARFPLPEYTVECDVRHTVWVRCADGSRSYGVAPWLLRRHSMDEVLDTVERKLRAPNVWD